MSIRLGEPPSGSINFMRRSRRVSSRVIRLQIVCTLPLVRIALDGMLSEGCYGELELSEMASSEVAQDRLHNCDALILVEPQNPESLRELHDFASQAGIPILLSSKNRPDFRFASGAVWIPFSAGLDQWRGALNQILLRARRRLRKTGI